MAEPTSTAAATAAATFVAVPPMVIWGISTGLRPDMLLAGLFGSLVSIVLLNSVPSSGDTWQHLIGTTAKRMFVAVASSVTAGYLTPLALLTANLPDSMMLAAAFGVGGFAQRVVMGFASRIAPAQNSPPPQPPQPPPPPPPLPPGGAGP